jgi:hypothetical protein
MDGLLDTYLRLALWLALGACLAVLVLPALPKLKSRVAKLRVHQRLNRALPASHYTVFRDVALRRDTPNGPETIQFDHLVVSPYGIFIIETHPCSGWIFGRERDPVWTRIHYRIRRNFQNPLIRGRARALALQELLALDPLAFHSLVVFAGSAELRTPMPPEVTRLGGMLPYIQVRTEELLGFDKAARAAAVIKASRLSASVQSTAAHIDRLRKAEGARFGARQAVLALVLMVSLSAVAGTLVHNLSELPGQFPGQREAGRSCPRSADTGLCSCADRLAGSGERAAEIAEEQCRLQSVAQSP